MVFLEKICRKLIERRLSKPKLFIIGHPLVAAHQIKSTLFTAQDLVHQLRADPLVAIRGYYKTRSHLSCTLRMNPNLTYAYNSSIFFGNEKTFPIQIT